ncbi:MAG: ABC transporter permease [Actinomycetota bacterium]|nr:ABC transporter permease [Actinomycetota bacterium]
MSDQHSPVPRPTDRGAWRLVAARDFRVRLRDKGFVISTGITLVVLSLFILARAFTDDTRPSFDLGLTGNDAAAIEQRADQVRAAAERRGVEVNSRGFDDERVAEAALRDGGFDAVLTKDGVLLGLTSVPPVLTQVVADAAVRGRLTAALEAGGATMGEIEALLGQPSIEVRTLEPQDPNRDENARIAFIAVLLAYGQLFGYGVWVATGVIEEKASRVVEILLSAIRPRQLLAGKIAGIGLLGIVQLVAVAAFAIGLASVTGALELPATAVGITFVVLAWFVMGFAFYAGLFAVSGSLVSRMEELQNVLVPVNLVIIVSFLMSLEALQDPDAPVPVIASLLPFSSALAMPVRIAMGSATAPQIALSIALLIAGTAALIPLSARLYAGAVLKTGTRVKLRVAWRSASAVGLEG